MILLRNVAVTTLLSLSMVKKIPSWPNYQCETQSIRTSKKKYEVMCVIRIRYVKKVFQGVF